MNNILTLDNKAYSLNNLPDQIDDFRFSILDNTDIHNPDFFFKPLIGIESFTASAIVLKIGNTGEITLPTHWKIAVGDPYTSNNIEVIPLTSLNDRGFEAFSFNPLTSFRPEFNKIEIINVYNEVNWYFPKIENGFLLSVPIHDISNPNCVFCVEKISRKYEMISLDKLL